MKFYSKLSLIDVLFPAILALPFLTGVAIFLDPLFAVVVFGVMCFVRILNYRKETIVISVNKLIFAKKSILRSTNLSIDLTRVVKASLHTYLNKYSIFPQYTLKMYTAINKDTPKLYTEKSQTLDLWLWNAESVTSLIN